MKVLLFVTITYLAGGVQTNVVPMDTMAACEAAAEQIRRANIPLGPNVVTIATCIVQGK